MTQLPRPKDCTWFLTSVSFFKFDDKPPEQNMLISSRTVAFSIKHFSNWISILSPSKSEKEHNLREDLIQQGKESDVKSSLSKSMQSP